jgi:hypothetical protein
MENIHEFFNNSYFNIAGILALAFCSIYAISEFTNFFVGSQDYKNVENRRTFLVLATLFLITSIIKLIFY